MIKDGKEIVESRRVAITQTIVKSVEVPRESLLAFDRRGEKIDSKELPKLLEQPVEVFFISGIMVTPEVIKMIKGYRFILVVLCQSPKRNHSIQNSLLSELGEPPVQGLFENAMRRSPGHR